MMNVVIAETATSTWNYHLRHRDLQERPLRALCGKTLGWDTQIPLSAWGKKSHLPESWCTTCASIADLPPAQP